MSKIRDVIQTHQERPIIKMAPDLVVYFDGLPYLINEYIGEGGVLVNHNDFVTTASGAVDVDSFIPMCSITISVPGDLKYLFQAPAGQRVLNTMMEVKVFAKGYYLTDKGESVYHRIFWGMISNINCTDNRKTLEITLTCKGILHLLDLMQINLAPSIITMFTRGGHIPGGLVTTQAYMSPWHAILDTFQTPLAPNVIDQTTIIPIHLRAGGDGSASGDRGAFKRIYASKWNQHLIKLQRGVRLFGLSNQLETVIQTPSVTKPNPHAKKVSPKAKSQAGSPQQAHPAAVMVKTIDPDLVTRYTPDFRIGRIDLLVSTIASRLARVKEMVDTIGWEGYTDLDGSVIIKPPLYNLDCTNTSSPVDRNPFIIRLQEIDGAETETEDESQIRVTIMSTKGAYHTLVGDAGADTLPEGIFLDPILLRQFGLRREPTKVNYYLGANKTLLYTYACAELNKLTRRYRTYSVTIPMRPELKVGFPIYMPHLDYYAYVDNITWSYTRGGKATMTVTGSAIRQREVFAQQVNTPDPANPQKTTPQWVNTPIPNLVLRWSSAPQVVPQFVPGGSGGATIPTGQMVTEPPPVPALVPSPEQRGLDDRERRGAATMETNADNIQGQVWRIAQGSNEFHPSQKVDMKYMQMVTQATMPYTDEKGYTLLRPFPWGRFTTLEGALDACTRSPSNRTGSVLPFEGHGATGAEDTFTGRPEVDPFIMTGLGTPTGSVVAKDPTKGTSQIKDPLVAQTLQSVYEFMSSDARRNSKGDQLPDPTFFIMAYLDISGIVANSLGFWEEGLTVAGGMPLGATELKQAPVKVEPGATAKDKAAAMVVAGGNTGPTTSILQ